MNGNDLMNALSGLDPKYIDEAAFELHGKPKHKNKTSASNHKKYLFFAVPAAAAALLTVAVAMPAILRMNKGDMASAPAPSSDSAEYAPSPGGEHSEEAKDSSEPSYSTDGLLEAYETAEAESEEGSWYSDTAIDSAAEAAKSAWSLTQATYYEGFLILHTDGAMPEDPGELSYAIKRMDADGTETIVAEGALGKVLTQTEPVTLICNDLCQEEIYKDHHLLLSCC